MEGAGVREPGKAGRKRKLQPRGLKRLERILLRGPAVHGNETELWTLERIAKAVEKEFHVSYHLGHVWHLLKEMGWSCQRPERRARERDDEAIERWVKWYWPRIKKVEKDQSPYRIS